jgi:hypothetical protein
VPLSGNGRDCAQGPWSEAINVGLPYGGDRYRPIADIRLKAVSGNNVEAGKAQASGEAGMIIILAVPLLLGLAIVVGARGLGAFKGEGQGPWVGLGVAVLIAGLLLVGLPYLIGSAIPGYV